MNISEIKTLLPHREPMLLIEQTELVAGVAHGTYTVKGDEWFLQGHFPDNPIVPGVILCEILAQSTCVLLTDSLKTDGELLQKTPVFTSLDKVRFKNSVRPGDRFETQCELTGKKGPFIFAKGRGFVQGKLCITAEFSFALV